MTITHHAYAETDDLIFDAYGSGVDGARDALLEGLRKHADDTGADPRSVGEVIADAKLNAVAAGGSRFSDEESLVVGHELVAGDDERPIAFRARVQATSDAFGIGTVDAYGTDEAAAMSALRAGLSSLYGHVPDADDMVEDRMRAATTLSVREGDTHRSDRKSGDTDG